MGGLFCFYAITLAFLFSVGLVEWCINDTPRTWHKVCILTAIVMAVMMMLMVGLP